MGPILERPGYAQIISGPYTWTGMVDGNVVGIGGIQEMWPGRGLAWALMSPAINPREFVRITNKVRLVLEQAHRETFRRIEASVDVGFDNGHRWARLLGFESEGLLRKFSPEGRDHIGYARFA